jgi:transposase-like protein
MKTGQINQTEKEKIIAEYLAGGVTYRDLQAKYGVDFRRIHHWVQEFTGNYQGHKPRKANVAKAGKDLPADVKQLQDELRKAKLHNQLLEALLDIGKEKYGVDLRKKAGTKQS